MLFKKKQIIKADERLQHVAFIMDGNGRWAKRRGMPREYGHRFGAKAFERIVRYCGEIGIKHVTFYTFSTENWKRPKQEVDSIMKLLDQYLDECDRVADENSFSMKFVGDLSAFDESKLTKIRHLEEKTKGRLPVVNIAINYGSKNEIVHAANAALSSGKGSISESDIDANLYTSESPDVDLVVRTGGELRLSNFLLWQSAYSELYFTDVLWPDFDKKHLDAAISDFYSRKRRYGGV